LSAVLSDALQAAGQRHLSHELGSSGEGGIARTFSTLWFLYTGVGALLVLVSVAAAYPLSRGLNVPEDRVDAVGWVIVLSGLTLAVTSARGPYLSLQFAYQRHFVVAMIETVMSVVRLGLAAVLVFVPGDPLIAWAGLLLGASVLAYTLMALAARSIKSARLSPKHFDRGKVKDLTGFGAWSVVGQLSWKLRFLVGQVVVLQQFAPQYNGSLALARQLSAFQTTLAAPINRAFTPAIGFHHGGARDVMVRRLVAASMRFDVLVAACVAVPLILDPYPFFELWLGAEAAAGFPELAEMTRFFSLALLASVVGRAALAAVTATGKIGSCVLSKLITEVVVMTGAVVHIVAFEGPAAALAYWAVGGSLAISAIEFVFMQIRTGIPALWLAREFVTRVAPVLAMGFASGAIVMALLDPTPLRPLLVGMGAGAVMSGLAWVVLFRSEERDRVVDMVRGAVAVAGRRGRSGLDSIDPEPKGPGS
jgi:O-antigen/teichoic acid export membrane protein